MVQHKVLHFSSAKGSFAEWNEYLALLLPLIAISQNHWQSKSWLVEKFVKLTPILVLHFTNTNSVTLPHGGC